MKMKAIIILLLFVTVFAVSNTTQVTAQDTDIPIIEEVSFTDGGATEIDTIDMVKPININAGELLVMILCSDNDGDATFFNAVDGWTKEGESGNSVCDSHIAVFYQIANGSEVNTNVTTATTANLLGWIMRLSGVDTSDAIEGSNFAASTAVGVNPQVVPSVTTFKDNTIVLYGLSFDGGDGYPMSVVSPYIEIADRTNTGSPVIAYASGTIGYRHFITSGDTGDAFVYTANVDGASYFQLAINGDIASSSTAIVETGFLNDLFYSTSIFGWFGPLMIIAVSFAILENKKYKPMGILFVIVEFLIISQYLALVEATPWYWWNIIIMLLGMILCIGQMWKR